MATRLASTARTTPGNTSWSPAGTNRSGRREGAHGPPSRPFAARSVESAEPVSNLSAPAPREWDHRGQPLQTQSSMAALALGGAEPCRLGVFRRGEAELRNRPIVGIPSGNVIDAR